jgi:hypothetical protein
MMRLELARSLCLLDGLTELNMESWERAGDLESIRRERLEEEEKLYRERASAAEAKPAGSSKRAMGQVYQQQNAERPIR